MIIRRGCAALALLMVAVALPSTATAATARAVRAAGDTVVTGSRPAKVVLELPAPATLDLRRDAEFAPRLHGVTIAGRGRGTGVVLRRRGGPELWAVKLGYCDVRACSSHNPDGVFGFDLHGSEAPVLPAGRYDLYLLTDGAPVTVHLTFQGLRGRTVVRPSTPVDVLQWVPPARRTVLGPSGVEQVGYVGSQPWRPRGPGALLTADVMVGKPVGQHYAEHWTNNGVEGPPGPDGDVCATGATRMRTRGTSEGHGPGWWVIGVGSGFEAGRYDLCEDAAYTGHVEAYQTLNLGLTW